ncbi:hypothetical protein JHC09_03165 [Devosia sp. MC532]|uniref:hypothetical protein n=1 Tax=Devosia sp. MC532 TaxID=2799788 RepID=UPI0018F6F10C|nr:hypothetical protein [Devosia sp. MC532]MBJ7576882.1 hypothetical protein [Devosia sp. MC532]
MLRRTAVTLSLLLATTSLAVAQSDIDEAIAQFTGANGFSLVDTETLEATLASYWLDTNAATPGGTVGPIEKALLIADDAIESTRTRTELSYGEMIDSAEDGSSAPVSFIEVRHFNLGPTIRAELAADLGEENVADAAEFGTGEHRAWRFVFTPTMNNQAILLQASTKEISAKEASKQDCQGTPCLESYRDFQDMADWTEVEGEQPDWPLLYADVADDVAIPAYAAARLATLGYWANAESGEYQWTYGEHPEGVERYEMYRFLSMDRNLGNEIGLDAVWHETKLNDDAVTDLWYRFADVAGFHTVFTASAGR